MKSRSALPMAIKWLSLFGAGFILGSFLICIFCGFGWSSLGFCVVSFGTVWKNLEHVSDQKNWNLAWKQMIQVK
jgi:hypothetical protein